MVFIVRGDISKCQASALVFSTSTALEEGELLSSFGGWPGFDAWYASLSRTREVGETDWLPGRGRRPGIVLVRAVPSRGVYQPEATVTAVLEVALERAVSELRVERPGERHLILVPALMTGTGGGHRRRTQIAEAAIEVAQAFVAASIEPLDIAFVLYTPASYTLYREARRRLGYAPIASELAGAADLKKALAAGECALFVGSGVSGSAGMRSWDALIAELARLGSIACPAQPTYEQKLAVAQTYRNQVSGDATLKPIADVVHDLFRSTDAPVLTHYLLAQLEPRFVFTTNYDRLIEDALRLSRQPWQSVTSAHDVPATSRQGVTHVVKLHGDATPPDERAGGSGYGDVVLSASDYDTFAERRRAFQLLLSGMMLNHTFLFIGYSLSDQNIRDVWKEILDAINPPGADEIHRRAFALAFANTEEPVPGLQWIANPGADSVGKTRAQWRQLDALAELVVEPQQMLAPDADEASRLAPLRAHLNATARSVVDALASGERLTADETSTLTRIIEVLYELGWRPGAGPVGPWERLADAASDRPAERRELLERALAHCSSAEEARRIRERRTGA